MEELRKYKKKNKILREQLQEFEESHQSKKIHALRTIKESEQIISDLKSQLLEAKRIEEVILKQLNDRKKVCEKLEVYIEMLRGELEKEIRDQNLKIVQISWMKFSVVKGHQITILVWDTHMTKLIHHKDLSKYQSIM
jgi:hypothetical protein